ncbi:helix-turn-helix domain-containing protein [Amycolatopsis samaneae]|uniref:Helix-turn-helix domain-containing protein n=1 Tax=Amycolatopsis samaneae TaxID=664691 RepID=A0ABW5GGV1_9PSEU
MGYQRGIPVGARPGGTGPAPGPDTGRGVLDGAFALLDALCDAGEAGLTHLSVAADLPKATAYRLLEQLTAHGVVEKSAGRYRVGLCVPMWGRAWRPRPAALRLAFGPMAGMARATGATVGLAVVSRGRAVSVGGVWGRAAAKRVSVTPGMAYPHDTAVGQALFGPLATSAADGGPVPGEADVVLDREEIAHGVCCAALPVIGPSDTPVAALCAVVDPAYPLPSLATVLARTTAIIQAAQH